MARKKSAPTPELEQTIVHPEPAEFQEHGQQRTLAGTAQLVLMAATLAFSTFQLVIAAFSPLSSQVARSLHVGFLMLIIFLLYPASKRAALDRIAWYDW